MSRIDRVGGSGVRRRGVHRILLLWVVLLPLVFGVQPAVAARTYDSQIDGGEGGFDTIQGIGFDSTDNLWIVDLQVGEGNARLQRGVYKYSAYPSLDLLEAPTVPPVFSVGRAMHLAVDQETDEVYVSQSNGRRVFIFKNGAFNREWNRIDGIYGNQYGIDVAIDNSHSDSRGRVYLSLTYPENDIEVLDSAQRPVELPATTSYIEGNKITGTPSGPFGEVGEIATDAQGNLYVNDEGEGVIDEFGPSGTFLRSFPALGPVAVDPTNGTVVIGEREFDPYGNFLGTLPEVRPGQERARSDLAFNSSGYLYLPVRTPGYEHKPDPIEIFAPVPPVPKITYRAISSPTETAGTLNAAIDPNGAGSVTECEFEYGEGVGNYNGGAVPCEAASSLPYTGTTTVSAELSSLTTGVTYHYRVALANAEGKRYGSDQTYTPQAVLALSTDAATEVVETGATLNGSFAGNGEDTYYYFEWGRTAAYGSTTVAPPGEDAGSSSGPDRTAVSADLTNLKPYTTYHFRIVASNHGGSSIAYGEDQMFSTPPGVPTITGEWANQVHSDRARIHGEVDPNGADTSYHFEYVDDASYQESGFADAKESPEGAVKIGRSKQFVRAEALIYGLSPGTLYHYRAAGTNAAGVGTPSVDRTFSTYPFTQEINDSCPNAHVRQQTGTALMFDCRAYELVSAANSDGYDVESNLVAGQTPFGGYPEAQEPPRVLYGIHDGALSVGNPTNHGIDPYVARRGPDGWKTEYVGIPAAGSPSDASFASTLLEADASLSTFAFGGPDICSPCFADGSAGEPIHLPGGELIQGMSGSIPQPEAAPAAFVGKHMSGDGSHFVFASTSPFEPEGDEGEVSIYDRNLATDVTHVVSRNPAGTTMTGAGVGELDISRDGSRIVIGQLTSESGGVKHWHLYMSIADSPHTIDLTPGTTSGVVYDGMTADGSRVYFTTTDRLTEDDTDSSSDLYVAEVSESGASISRVSVGADGSGNSDACDPSANTKHEHWNTSGSEVTCGVVAIGGGGGVASGNGTVFFLSPEMLDGPSNGVQNAPNLYLAEPGSSPRFIATLESSLTAPLPPASHPFVRTFGSFGKPSGVAIEHTTGDVYVLDIGNEAFPATGYVLKFDSSGHAITSFGQNGKIEVSGVWGSYGIPTELAIDQSTGNLYVPSLIGNTVEEYSPSGERLKEIEVGLPTGVAIDQANGRLYVTSYSGGVSIFDGTGSLVTSFATVSRPTGVAVDSSGTAYVVNGGGPIEAHGVTEMYNSSGADLGLLDGNRSLGVAADPTDEHLYVDEGTRVVEFDSTHHPINEAIGEGRTSESIGLAADAGRVDVSDVAASTVDSYGPAVLPNDPSTDNPLVVDSVDLPGTRKPADFQVTPSGGFAVFSSTAALTGYDNASHEEIFRYSAQEKQLVCISCNPTGARPTAGSSLASDGLSLTDDGSVFFNSDEGLVDRDVNERSDAYEWESGQGIQLISTGTSAFPAALLGVDSNGVDAYFFTRDKLAREDENGNTVRIYDARVLGGFPHVPAAVPCKASDECHGPGTVAPGPPSIGSVVGTPEGGPVAAAPCRRGVVRKHGKCVKPHRHRRHHRHHPKYHRRGHRHG